MSRLLSSALVLAMLLAWGAPAAAQSAVDPRTDQLATLINAARVERGLQPLARNPQLDAAANEHSRDMVAHNYLDHTGSDNSTPQQRAERAGYRPQAETLVVEVISAISSEPEGPLDWWLNQSPAVHGKVLTDPSWREMGVGYAAGGEYGNYWTVLVGRDLASRPTLTATSSAGSSGDIEVRWSGIASPQARDWLGLYPAGSSASTYLAWVYVSCARMPISPRASGWCWLRLPDGLPSGSYELRLHADDGYEPLATSSVSLSASARDDSLYWR